MACLQHRMPGIDSSTGRRIFQDIIIVFLIVKESDRVVVNYYLNIFYLNSIMGKPSPTRDTSFSWNYMPRHIAHRVAMHQQHPNAANAFIPKMAKQKFAFSAGLRTRMLTWKAIPEVLHNEAIQAGACTGTCEVTGLNVSANSYWTMSGPPCSMSSILVNQKWAHQQKTNEKCKENIIALARSGANMYPGGPLVCCSGGNVDLQSVTCCPGINPLICPNK